MRTAAVGSAGLAVPAGFAVPTAADLHTWIDAAYT